MTAIPLGLSHDPGCACRRCLAEAYRTAKLEVSEATIRYHQIRRTSARTAAISLARQQWTEARQVLVLAEHNLRTSEDEEYAEQRENQRTDALRWDPETVVPR